MAAEVLPNAGESLVRCGNGHLDCRNPLEGDWSSNRGIIKPKKLPRV